MKNILLILLILASLHSYAQVTITGTVKNAGKKIILSYWKDFDYTLDTIKLDKNSKFKVQYPIHEPLYVRLQTIEPEFYSPFFLALPNETLELLKDKSSLIVRGDLQQYNQFLLQLNDESRTLFKNPLVDYNVATKYLLDRSDKFFSAFTHPKHEMIRDLHNFSIVTNYKLYPVLVRYDTDTNKMKALYNFWKDSTSISENDEFLRYFDRIDFSNENIRFVNLVDISMINNFIRVLRSQAVQKDSALNEVDQYVIEDSIIKQLLKGTPFRSRLLGYNLYYRIKHYTEYPTQLSGVEDFINDYRNEKYSAEFLPAIESLYNDNIATKGTLVKGASAPYFNLPDEHGNLVSLTDFKGKVVYLDLWASWCGPCLKEISYLNRLSERFKDKKVAFVSISIDTDPKKWLQKLAGMKPQGVQLIDSNGAENSRIAKDYKVYGVPHYILIDRNGKIISASAPRPSSEMEIENEINKLLQ